MTMPVPTPIFRFLHIENLAVCLQRRALHTPNHCPDDGLTYRTIHNVDIQQQRRRRRIPCGPGGVIHDYLAFYFGYLSPVLFQLKTGRVQGYTEGQEPLIYLVSSVQAIHEAGLQFVFSDGHGIAFDTHWYADVSDLDKVDWNMVYQRYWAADYERDMDRQRRKQAEFLVYRQCDWALIQEIGVLNTTIKARVEDFLEQFGETDTSVNVRLEWYY
jgi:hypothetical protein